jgi:hypothetical protein
MRTAAGGLLAGSVIALLVGLANASGHVQIGGDDGFILRGWLVIVGSITLGVGALGFLGSYDANDRIVWSRGAVPLALMAGTGVLLIVFGETPEEFCGSAYLVNCP